MTAKADLILHPIRLRIIQALLRQPMTAQEMALRLPDVPMATLYRHLKRLAEGDIVSIVSESRMRGAVERTYAVRLEQTVIAQDDLRQLDKDGHMRLFMAFIASVIDGFERYLKQSQLDLVGDGVSYSQATVYLSDDELREMRAQSADMVQRALTLPPAPGRRARVISSIVVPEPAAGSGQHASLAGKGRGSLR